MLEVNSYLMAPNEDIHTGSAESPKKGVLNLDALKRYATDLVGSRATSAAAVAAVILGATAPEKANASEMPIPEFGAPEVFDLPPRPENGDRMRISEYIDSETGELRVVYRDQDFDAETVTYYISGLGELNFPEGVGAWHISVLPDAKVRFLNIYTYEVVEGTLDGTNVVDVQTVHTVDSQIATIASLTGEESAFTYYAAGVDPEGSIREVYAYNEARDSLDVDFTGSFVLDDEYHNTNPSVSGDYTTFYRSSTNTVVVAHGPNLYEVPGAKEKPFLNVEEGILTSFDPESGNILVQHIVPEGPKIVGSPTIDGLGVAKELSSGEVNLVETGSVTLRIPMADDLGPVNPDIFALYEQNPVTGEFTDQVPAAMGVSTEIDGDGVTNLVVTFDIIDGMECHLKGGALDIHNNGKNLDFAFTTIDYSDPPVEEPDLYVHGESVDTDYGKIDASGDAFVDLDPATTPSDSDVMVGLTTEDPEDTDLLGHAKFSELVDDFSAALDAEGARSRVDVIEGDGFEVRMTYGVAEAGEDARAVPFTDFEVLATDADLIFYYGDEMLEMEMGETASLADFQEETKNPNVKKAPVDERPSGCSVIPGTSGMLAVFVAGLATRRRREQ